MRYNSLLSVLRSRYWGERCVTSKNGSEGDHSLPRDGLKSTHC